MHASKATKQAKVETKPPTKFSRSKRWANKPKREYTPLGEPLDVVFKTLLQNQILTPLDNTTPYDPQPRPNWWNESAYCEYHRNKGHKTSSCIQWQHKFQDLINNGNIVVDGHNKNFDHQSFKDPFPPHNKGESSRAKDSNTKVNFTYNANENIINMIGPVDFEYYDVITIKGKGDNVKSKTPFVFCRSTPQSPEQKSPQTSTNVVTRSHAKVILKGPAPSTSVLKQPTDEVVVNPANKNPKLVTSTNNASYNILDQLQ